MSTQFDFKDMTVRTTDGNPEFVKNVIPFVKFQCGQFAVVEIPTVLKNGQIGGGIGGDCFCLVATDDSRLNGESVTSNDTAFIQLGLPDGWKIYDVSVIGRFTIAVFLEHESLKETK